MHRKNDDKNILNIVLIFAFVSDNLRSQGINQWPVYTIARSGSPCGSLCKHLNHCLYCLTSQEQGEI